MTKTEFENWKAHTELSTFNWCIDLIHNGQNEKGYLFYRGGMDGQFINVDNGLIKIGDYIGALPHIGEAMFEPLYTKQFDNNDDALKCLIEKAGLGFLTKIVDY